MKHRSAPRVCWVRLQVLVWSLAAGPLLAAEPPAYLPDPAAVQRFGPATRAPQAGWILLHLEGQPQARGVQHGRLLAAEIADFVKCQATLAGPKAPSVAWNLRCNLVNALFLRGFTAEQLEEMQGIAEGASAAGATFAGRPISLLDIATLNCADELDALEGALKASPTGLDRPKSGTEQPGLPPPRRPRRPERCSAFAATGPATRDGKIVFGHITMWDLYPAQFFNIWLDLVPDQGHRFVMQTFPGGIQSGMDYSINDAGILMSETTLDPTGFDPKGRPLAARVRLVEQYAESIDQVTGFLGKQSNGLATAEWVLADLKTNEIALFTLGTHQNRLRRSSRQEWLDGAEGCYWSCNNNKEAEVRLETLATLDGRPSAAAAFQPTRRDEIWRRLFDQNRGRIDADFARKVLTTPQLVAAIAVDSKCTTADLAAHLQSWAAFGPPAGGIRVPSADVWLTTAFANYEPFVAREHQAGETADAGVPDEAARDRQGLELFYFRSLFELGARAGPERPLAHPESSLHGLNGFNVAAGKGVLLLHGLRGFLGPEHFDRLMDEFGRTHAGQEITVAQFQAFLARGSGRDLAGFFHRWLEQPGLPHFELIRAATRRHKRGWITTLELTRNGLGEGLPVPVAVEGPSPATRVIFMNHPMERVEIETNDPPVRVRVDPWGLACRDGGPPFTILSCENELEKTLIVTGTQDETEANRETALAHREALRLREFNLQVEIRKDTELTEADLATHHLLLIGRPDSNALVARFRGDLPVSFGPHSFKVRGQCFANSGSAVLMAVENPCNPRYAMVVLAGLSGGALLPVVARYQNEDLTYAPLLVLPYRGEEQAFVPPARALVRTFEGRTAHRHSDPRIRCTEGSGAGM